MVTESRFYSDQICPTLTRFEPATPRALSESSYHLATMGNLISIKKLRRKKYNVPNLCPVVL